MPFVGCHEMDEGRYREAPPDRDLTVNVDSATAMLIAYYTPQSGPGVFAPRGWHCLGRRGTARNSLAVSPTPIDSAKFDLGFTGPAVEIEEWNGGTSGRFEVAILSSQLFPAMAKSFIDRVRSESVTPDSEFGRGPYINDSVSYPSPAVAEVITPGHTVGFGTEGDFVPTEAPIRAVAVLDTSAELGTLQVFRVRLTRAMTHLEAALVLLNEACMAQVCAIPTSQ